MRRKVLDWGCERGIVTLLRIFGMGFVPNGTIIDLKNVQGALLLPTKRKPPWPFARTAAEAHRTPVLFQELRASPLTAPIGFIPVLTTSARRSSKRTKPRIAGLYRRK